MDHLKNQKTHEQLLKELEPENFPTGLDEVVEKVYSNPSRTESDFPQISVEEMNRCLVESLAKMRHNRQVSAQARQNISVARQVQQKCETCQLLSFQDSHFKISLIKLMYSSIFCQICHTLCRAIILLDPHWLKDGHSTSILDIEKRQNMLCFQVQSLEAGQEFSVNGSDSRWGFPMVMHIFSSYELGGPWSKLSIHQPIASHSGSDECLEKIRRWLNTCENDHLQCSRASRQTTQRSEGNLIAARVIDLGSTAHISASLISTAGVHITRWTTLSYCWGGNKYFITTESNLESRQQSMPWSSIPQTFQEAMTLTHRLGIRYIWIDAVCIIQDSKEDWKSEASKMGNIYQHAYLVIAADLSISCDSGIFASRERHSLPIDIDNGGSERSHARKDIFVEKGSSLDYTSQQSEPSEWHTGSFLRHSVLESNSRTLNKRWLNPTLRRAWCFQERMLATRIIHFTAAELIWECKSKIDCECGLRKSSESTLKQSLDISLEKAAAVEYPDFTKAKVIASKMWWKLVVEYSWCDLTVPSDRLPAISGLARLFPQLGKYWAGMWSQELPLSLLWREESVDNPVANEGGDNDKYVAPSWSWASALYPIQQPVFNPGEIIAAVVNVDNTLVATDIYGQILDSRLVLKGLVLDGMIRYISNSFFGKLLTQIELINENGTTIPGMDYEGAKLSFKGDYRTRQSGQSGEILMQRVMCIAIKSTFSPEHGKVLDCLVLRLSKAEDGSYERIGLLTCIDHMSESERAFKKMAEVTVI